MISVITPVYNGEKFIESCIKVVINQNSPDVEHIISDGGSTDGTVDIIQEYAQKYPHIQWISEKDKGQSDAMNKGIAMARGEILAILNVDDYYEQNVLNRVSEIFKTLTEPSLLVGNCNVWDNEGRLIFINKPAKLKFTELLLGAEVNPHPVNPAAYFYHKSLHEKIGFYKVEEHFVMDLDFLLRAVQAATVTYINETWGNYRLLEDTKTVVDMKNGQSIHRAKQLLKAYRKQLPLVMQWKIFIKSKLYRTKVWQKLKYFSSNRQELLPSFKAKVAKILN
ncbi:glycosyltransferase family 2 protein [Pelatocladus sp. BLCC-F211]|uniref:glycosyltransferase family 2 protein n=1 Tax=Pelatocladus sp. BLCC-F211 TaxID=3342752 RepID=UPI0035B86B5B